MAEPAEEKNHVAERLDQDREQLAFEVVRLKSQYDFPSHLRVSIQRDPLPWVIGAAMAGFLLSLLPARRKKIYLAPGFSRSRPTQNQSTPFSDRIPVGQKLWNLAKPLISTYIGQQIYKRLYRSLSSVHSVKV